jgi:hypothetical protein
VFYVTYLLVEVPSNLVMKKVKPNRWIPFLVGTWGAVGLPSARLPFFCRVDLNQSIGIDNVFTARTQAL